MREGPRPGQERRHSSGRPDTDECEVFQGQSVVATQQVTGLEAVTRNTSMPRPSSPWGLPEHATELTRVALVVTQGARMACAQRNVLFRPANLL